MLMTNLNLKSLLVALVCCLFSLSASAQFKASGTMLRDGGAVLEFNLTEVATQLGTDTATIVNALVEGAVNRDETKMFLLQDAEDPTVLYDTYTAIGFGFWMTTESKPINWGVEGFAWYTQLEVDAEEDGLYLFVGNNGDAVKVDDVLKATFVLKYNDKEATFAIDMTIIAPPTFDLPEPELQISKLTVVAEKEFAITQIANNVYKADQVTVDLTGVAELLGTTDETLAGAIGEIVYGVKAGWEFADQKADSLTNAFTAGALGFWFNRLGDGESYVTDECVVGDWGGSGCAFFAEAFAYNAESKTLTASLGMFPGVTEVTRYADIYLVVGNKAAKVRLTLTVEPVPTLPLSQMTKVGEETVELERTPTAGYTPGYFSVDADAIAEKLGCEPADLEMVLLASDEESLQNWGETDGWMTETGTATNWGNGNVICIKYPSGLNADGSYGNFEMCQEAALENGAVYTTPIYLKYQNSYYVLTVVTTIKGKEFNPDDFDSVAERNLSIKANNLSVYEIPSKVSIPLNDLETLLGTTSPTLYGQKKTEDGFSYSDEYSCDPKPGFWMSNDGYVSTWNSANTDWGVTYASGVFTFWQMPDKLVVGQVYAGTVYLRNDETGKMITVNLSVTCTDEYIAPDVKLEQVGSESVAVGMETVNDATSGELELDLTKMIEALELSADEDDLYDFFSSGSKCLVGENASGEWAAPMSIEEGQYFDVQGKVVADINDQNFYVYLEYNGGETAMLYVDGVDPVAEGEAVMLKIGFVNGNNVYAFYVTLMNEEDLTGISTAKVTNADGQIYDLSGRKVVKAQKGVYIQNGKKFVVK